MEGSIQLEFNYEKEVLAILDKSSKVRLVYSTPVVLLSDGPTIALPLEWDSYASSLSVTLPSLSFPLILGFGIGLKLPEGRGGFELGFPSFKFELPDRRESDTSAPKKSGIKVEKYCVLLYSLNVFSLVSRHSLWDFRHSS